MPNLFVSYDLMAPNKNYPAVEQAIRQLGTVSRVLLSVWYVKTQLTAEQARNHVSSALDQNDKLLVIDAKDAFAKNLDPAAWKTVTDNWSR
jgi:hypothetical protein